MWSIDSHEDVLRKAKRFARRWRREIINIFDNLETLQESLNNGTKPEQLKLLGFVHSEPLGILAIDQKGPTYGAGRLKQFRLYVYPDEGEQILHIRKLADKSRQSDDLEAVKSFVTQLLAEKEDN